MKIAADHYIRQPQKGTLAEKSGSDARGWFGDRTKISTEFRVCSELFYYDSADFSKWVIPRFEVLVFCVEVT